MTTVTMIGNHTNTVPMIVMTLVKTLCLFISLPPRGVSTVVSPFSIIALGSIRPTHPSTG